MTAHVANVQALAGLTPTYRGVCSCGWEGEAKAKRTDAQADALQHATGKTPTRRPRVKREGKTGN